MVTASISTEIRHDAFGPSVDRGTTLSNLVVRASGPPSLRDYQGLFETCLDTVEPMLRRLDELGYRVALFIAGAELSSDKRATYPNYSLFGPASKLGVSAEATVEHDSLRDGTVRTAGLYQVKPADIVAVWTYMSRSGWALGIITKRPEALTRAGLERSYRTIAVDADGRPNHHADWISASRAFTPLGDVVMRVEGWADDKFREVEFLFDRKQPVGAIFGDDGSLRPG